MLGVSRSGAFRPRVVRFEDLAGGRPQLRGGWMRVKLFALLSAAVLFVLAAAPASATSGGDSYLALGDSVPFGFNPLLDASNASNFVGYPEIVAQRLNIEEVNATCPGEAAGGFLSLTGTDNVCRPYR